ncbi:hypothetical protein HK104_005241 [Borealophlyctis nickersoniae]|nr:hypothetical protein HK104_005241 [Borealophlyctis nickersoniae]
MAMPTLQILVLNSTMGQEIGPTDEENIISIFKEAIGKSENGRRAFLRGVGLEIDKNGIIARNVATVAQGAVRLMDVQKLMHRMELELPNIQSIVIVSKPKDSSIPPKVREIVEFILNDYDINIYVDSHLQDQSTFGFDELKKRGHKYASHLKIWTEEFVEEEGENIGLAITLGGDGTVLYAAKIFQKSVPPVLAFNLGSLGFLANFHYDEMRDVLGKILKGQGMRVNLRMRLHCSVHPASEQKKQKRRSRSAKCERAGVLVDDEPPRDACPLGEVSFTSEALNELVLYRGANPGLVMLELYADGMYVTTIQADGLVLATSTGSTAYSLSAGGSLVHPDKTSILVTPICSHTLTTRPMLLPATMEVKILVAEHSRATAWLSLDGRNRTELKPNDAVCVTASRYPFLSICRKNQTDDWFRSLIAKLHWNEREKQKAYE